MTHIQCTTDPISQVPLHLLPAYHKLPSIKDCRGDYCLSIFFESRKNRDEFLRIPLEPSTLDLKCRDDIWVDEG